MVPGFLPGTVFIYGLIFCIYAQVIGTLLEEMELLTFLVLGLIIGSFLNVVIYRYDDWVSIAKTRSNCPECKTNLNWYDLVPVLSYLTLKGKCRYCQKPISWQYPIVELATGILFATGYTLIFINSEIPSSSAVAAYIFYAIAVSAAVVVFFHDLYEMLIPDLMAYILLVASILFSLFYYQDWLGTLYAVIIGYGAIALLVYPSKGKWMGEGDLKISAAMGALVGYPGVIAYLIISFMLGGLYGAVALGSKKVKLRTAVPFAPFLIIGAILSLLYATRLINWYLGVIGYSFY
jgi:prepilin signal peptidase PulO-like enzyme (type II secretory pathway)